MPEPVFQAHGVTKVYRSGEVEVHALRGLDIDLYERAHFRHKGGFAPSHLPDIATAHQHTLGGIGPVDPPDLNPGIVPAAIENIGLGDAVGGQDPLGILGIDRQVGMATELRCRKP